MLMADRGNISYSSAISTCDKFANVMSHHNSQQIDIDNNPSIGEKATS